MRKLMPLLACLMLLVTTWASIGHATEISGCVEVTSSDGAQHVDGDGDQVPADADNAFPHHHNSCHGHHVGTPAIGFAFADRLDPAGRLNPAPADILTISEPDPARRPPRA
ncbi:hypothetical protein KX816_05545 [Sphingosinicellaceae bacterium]|nr:hypothetical protein KX816_05545 [Sphingosinicellaceae bacterium]